MKNEFNVIDEFNLSNSISDVIERCAGINIKGKSFPCPIHNGDNKNGASINIAKNIFSCWTSDCGKGLTPWNFIKEYYKLSTFKEIAEKVNYLFDANIPIFQKNKDKEKQIKKFQKPQVEFNETLNNKDIYISLENKEILYQRMKEFKHLVVNANTGIGKTYTMTELSKQLCKELNLDYVFFIVPTRSIVENVSSEYEDFRKFYKDDCCFNGKYTVMTFNKSTLANKLIDNELRYRYLVKDSSEFKYMVILDEAHELLSKRNILGITLSKEIENLIINSDYSVCMSANTIDFLNAYSESKMYNYSIKIQAERINYNADNLYFYRCSGNEKIRLKQICDKIIGNLGTHENILVSIDNKKELKALSEVLNSYGIENIIINSENKNDEEIEKEYLSIVEVGKLKKIVVLCTSIINAGVNIRNKNVLTVIYQNKTSFDINKIEQIAGRVRSNINNDVIVFLNNAPEKFLTSHKVLGSIGQKFKGNIIKVNNIVSELNEYWFDEYYDNDDNFKKHLEMIVENEEYKEFRNYLYIDSNILKVDKIGLYEKSRLEWLKLNYYNNDFIKVMLQDIKAKNVHEVIILVDDTKIDIDIKEEDQEKTPLDVYLNKIKEDPESLLELYSYLNRNKKSKDFTSDLLIQMHEEHKNNDKYKNFISTLKKLFTGLDDTTHDIQYLKYGILMEVLNVFTIKEKNKPLSKRKREKLIDNIKRKNIYNKIYPLGSPSDLIKKLGDIEYANIRYLDKLYNQNHKVTDKHLKLILESIFKDRQYVFVLDNETFEETKRRYDKITEEKVNIEILKKNVSGCWYDKSGKKINFQRKLEELKENIKVVYDFTDKFYIQGLS